MFAGFKKFIMRGNVVDLAVAVVIGVAFGAVVTSLVANIITPLIAAIGGKPDFSALAADVNGSHIAYGLFLNALFSFIFIAAAVYFFVVAPLNALNERRLRGQVPPDATVKKCPECLNDIPVGAHRCGFCTSQVA